MRTVAMSDSEQAKSPAVDRRSNCSRRKATHKHFQQGKAHISRCLTARNAEITLEKLAGQYRYPEPHESQQALSKPLNQQ